MSDEIALGTFITGIAIADLSSQMDRSTADTEWAWLPVLKELFKQC